MDAVSGAERVGRRLGHDGFSGVRGERREVAGEPAGRRALVAGDLGKPGFRHGGGVGQREAPPAFV